jgi:hypothetical protein
MSKMSCFSIGEFCFLAAASRSATWIGSFGSRCFLPFKRAISRRIPRPITPLFAIGSIEHFCRPPIVVFAS